MAKSNDPPSRTSPSAAAPSALTADSQRIEFGRRLTAAIREKGWSQAELARRATAVMTGGQKLEKYSVNLYIKGKSMPEPVRLDAICRALDVTQFDLLPGWTRISSPNPLDQKTLEATDAGDGKMWLTVRKRLRTATVLKILQLVHEDDEDGKTA